MQPAMLLSRSSVAGSARTSRAVFSRRSGLYQSSEPSLLTGRTEGSSWLPMTVASTVGAALGAASASTASRQRRAIARNLHVRRPAVGPESNEGKPEWEFEVKNAQVFETLATTMRIVAAVFLTKALTVNGALSLGTYLMHPKPEFIYNEIFGEFAEMFDYIFFSLFLFTAARDMEQVATTTGRDITYLMRAMVALLTFFKRLIIVGSILVIKGVASTWARLSALPALEQIVPSAPMGIIPPHEALPIGFVLVTLFMIILGWKSLQDDYSQIAPRMQPPPPSSEWSLKDDYSQLAPRMQSPPSSE
eukprot:TRINITY_DN70118_c0_g1_i1.p1 TRINITY_DN70118_c0_g1~~TRINITY_DN70118_c0_g1_i1.p1  ORF type:complete len:305 (-),score=41.28 TRINITY_DN70118_c0_g1_i1:93-1007(-)